MKVVKLLFLPIFIVLVILAFYLFPKFIKIQKIECQTQFGECEKVLIDKFSIVPGQNLAQAQKNFKIATNSEIVIVDSRSQFVLPNLFKIYLVLKTPKYAIRVNDTAYALVGEDGYVISLLGSTNYPYLTGEFPSYSVGEAVSEEVHFALEILRNVNYLYLTNSAKLENSSLHIELEDGTRVIFPLEGNVRALVGSLRLIVSEKKELSESLSLKQIDLRFKNPVLK